MNVTENLYHQYLSKDDLVSYDPYDIWNTKLGQVVKKKYYTNRFVGFFPSALLLFFDNYLNNNYHIGYNGREYPMVHAYRTMIATELYRQKPDPELLNVAKSSLNWLANNSSKGYNGYCWGANMPWVSKNGIYKENTPYITNTPYVLEALLQYQNVTSDSSFSYIIPTIYDFIEKDIQKIIDTAETLAVSYSPEKEHRIVLNANSYAIFCYSLFYSLYPEQSLYISDKINRLYHFIKTHQQPNGSWHYYADNLPGNFIDCFHSCFILKNLYKANLSYSLEGSAEVISAGYEYLKSNFYDSKRNLFRRFAKSDNLSLIKFDLYDNAEMLHIATLLLDRQLVDKLHVSIKENFIVDNDIYSQIIFPRRKIHKNTLRWAVMPLLYALVKSNYKFS